MDEIFRLTHSHLDHCGRIPLLVKQGFKGEVITTAAAVELTRLITLDSTGLQEEEARYQLRKVRRRGGSRADNVGPLYTTLDALNSLELFGRQAGYDQAIQLAPGIRVTFIDTGHILGSASIILELEEDGRQHRLLFSGDLGYSGRAILRSPATPPHVDTVVMETTYGDRLHKQLQPSIEELYDAINDTVGRGGNVIIRSFALERAQEILYYLREGVENKFLKHYANVFLDSPMAISATQVFERHPECFNDKALVVSHSGNDPFDLPGLRVTRETAESMSINKSHHLKHNLWCKECSIVFVGYSAQGTLTRMIIDGVKRVRTYGEDISVRASIHTIGGFSAHADQAELLAWHQQMGNPEPTLLVHGEVESMQGFEKRLTGTKIEMPSLNQAYRL